MKAGHRSVSFLALKYQTRHAISPGLLPRSFNILRPGQPIRTFGAASRAWEKERHNPIREHGPPWQALSQQPPSIQPKLVKNSSQSTEGPEDSATQDAVAPAYELTFTCKPCKTRSAHRITKQGYHKGSVLITCPNCKVRHVISDHLKIFGDEARSFEQILSKSGELIRKGTISEDGDLEFWDNGAVTARGDQKDPRQ